jgi:thioredoxin-related protein
MKSFISIRASLIGLCFSSLALAGREGWTSDMTAAKKQAEESKSDLLLEFTGSDWCGPCIELNKEVFALEPFKAGVKGKFVCVELDFPKVKKDLTAETIKQNNELLKEYKIQGYPTILLCDASGRPYANAGQGNSPEAYVKHLDTLRSRKTQRDEALSIAYKSKGPAQAKALIAALEAMDLGDDIILHFYSDIFKQIKAADPQDEIGYFKGKESEAQGYAAMKAREVRYDSAMAEGYRLVRRAEYRGFFVFISKLIKDIKLHEQKTGRIENLHREGLRELIKQATVEHSIRLDDARQLFEEAKVAAADDKATRDNVEQLIKEFEEAIANPPAEIKAVDLGKKGSKEHFAAAMAEANRFWDNDDYIGGLASVSKSIKEGEFNEDQRGWLGFFHYKILEHVVKLDIARQLLEEAKATAPDARTRENVEAFIKALDEGDAKTLTK